MPPTMSRSRRARAVPMPSEPSADFQRALRLCHKQEEDGQTSSEDENIADKMTGAGSTSAASSSSRRDAQGQPTASARPPTPPRPRRNGAVTTSTSDSDAVEALSPNKPSDTPARSPQGRTSIPDSPQGFALDEERLPHSHNSVTPSSLTGEGRLPSRRRLSLPLIRKSDARELLRVQWADEVDQDLVREHPRKRYERKPSLQSEPPRPILKRSSSCSGSLNEEPDEPSS